MGVSSNSIDALIITPEMTSSTSKKKKKKKCLERLFLALRYFAFWKHFDIIFLDWYKKKIEVKNVSKMFKKPIRKQGSGGMIKTMFSTKYEKVTAVNHVSFTIVQGEIVVYIGANSADKSTTIKMMFGLLTPSEGQVLIDGLEPYKSRSSDFSARLCFLETPSQEV